MNLKIPEMVINQLRIQNSIVFSQLFYSVKNVSSYYDIDICCKSEGIQYNRVHAPIFMNRVHATIVVSVTLLVLRGLDPSCQRNLYSSNKI